MKTQAQVLAAIAAGRKSECLDQRDYGRLCDFFPTSDWKTMGFEPKPGVDFQPTEWTEENVKQQLGKDLAFGFEKALNKRGISAGLMYEVVKMWLWVLDDDLQYFDDYAQYGLPLFRAVAIKYDFVNPIGNDRGDEHQYSSEG